MSVIAQFYDQHVDKVYKYFYINSLNRHIAEDLTSQTFLAFLEKSNKANIENQKAYLYAIMRNVWSEYLRQKYKQSVEQIESIDDFETHIEEVVSDYESKNIKQRASVFINKLPEKQRKIATMRLLEEKTIKEIAQELGKDISYVKTTQQRAIKSLKSMLKQPELGGINI